jgi:hypothetical protein
MAGIKYEADLTIQKSPKGKMPWMTVNGQVVADSYFCINYLKEHFKVDLSAHLTPVERAQARSFLKLAEESLRWAAVVFRFRYGQPEHCGLNPFVFGLIGKKMLKESEAQGYGKHSKEERIETNGKSITNLSIIKPIYSFFVKFMRLLLRTPRP